MRLRKKWLQKSVSMCLLSGLLLMQTSCKVQDSSEKNFRATRGWWGFKEQAALMFLPYSVVYPDTTKVEDFHFCSYYVQGDAADDKSFNYLNLIKATNWSPKAFTLDSLFQGILEKANKDKSMAQLTMNWASGAASLSGDFLAQHKGKIEGTVVATALAAAAITVTCTVMMKSSPPTCSKLLPSISAILTPASVEKLGNSLKQASQVSNLPRKVLSNRKFQGIASFLSFALNFLPGDWAKWILDNSTEDDTVASQQMTQLLQHLNEPGTKVATEQRLESIVKTIGTTPEEVRWDDLQTIKVISLGAGEASASPSTSLTALDDSSSSPSATTGAAAGVETDSSAEAAANVVKTCPRPAELDAEIIKNYFGLKTGWAKG